jgi:intracellular sulfur oxidation DsrE/DsrF family protein
MILAGIWLLTSSLASSIAIADDHQSQDPVPVKHRDNIRVVYQIKTNQWKEGVGSGLHYVDKLVGAYHEMGIENEDFQISAVLHGDAGYWLLNNPAYQTETGKPGANPNRKMIRRLIDNGVSVELCAQTMKQHGWAAEDLLEDVVIVIGAYPRIIDLQHMGYAYIRF